MNDCSHNERIRIKIVFVEDRFRLKLHNVISKSFFPSNAQVKTKCKKKKVKKGRYSFLIAQYLFLGGSQTVNVAH